MGPPKTSSHWLAKLLQPESFCGAATGHCLTGLSHLRCSSFGCRDLRPFHCPKTRSDRLQRLSDTHFGCSRHGGEWSPSGLEHEQVIAASLPASSADQTEPLDLSVSRSLKRFHSTPIRVSIMSRQSAHVKSATAPGAIASAFRAAGLLPYQQDVDAFLRVDGPKRRGCATGLRPRTSRKEWVSPERGDESWRE
jgi:hypothetical protein